MTHWKRLSRRVHYSSDWLTVTLDKVELPDGRIIENFELMHYPHDAVGVVAVNNAADILLVRAYRYLHESFDWEIPGGVIEPDETAIEACRRELLEETGHTAEILTPMLTFFPHKATCDQRFHLYLAESLKKEKTEIDRLEIAEVGFHSPTSVRRMIEEGEIDEGMSLVALQRYFLKSRG